MKLLILCNRIPYPPKDGGSLAMYKLIQGYFRAGVEVSLIAINTRKHYLGEDSVSPLQAMAKVYWIYLDTDIKATDAFLNLFSKKSYNIERFNAQEVHEKVAAVLKEESFDVIQLESIFMAPYLPTIRQFSNAPVVLRAHNVENEIWYAMAEREKNVLKQWYLRLLAKRLAAYEKNLKSAFDGVLPISDHDAHWFQKSGFNAPMHITPVGINTEEFPGSSDPAKPGTLFHIGSLDWMPNEEALEWFIEAIWPSIKEAVPEATFHVAGRHMPEWVHQLNEPGIEIAGEVDDAKGFMIDKQIMVVPLLSGSGIRVKILEGMALGKCIVTTSLGAEGINCRHGEHLFMADEDQTFAMQVVDCLKAPEKALQIGKNAARFVNEHYDNQSITEQVLDFFQKSVIASSN